MKTNIILIAAIIGTLALFVLRFFRFVVVF